MKIKIIQCSSSNVMTWWYKDCIGEEFEVIQIDGKPKYSEFYFLVKRENETNSHVRINDAQFIGKSSVNILHT
jgi:hypothetical protein